MISTEDRADLYVLGLLDADEASQVEIDLASDPALAAAVATARDRYSPIDDTADPVMPSGGLWPRIEAALGDARELPVVRYRAPTPWRTAALAALAASVVLAVALAWQLLMPPAPQVVAVLLDSDGAPVAVIEDFGGERHRVVALSAPDAPAEATFQVWTKWSEDVGPVSLGVLESLNSADLSSTGLPPPSPGQLYEITIEGPGGSPTGLPTGPIVGLGRGQAPR